MPPSLLTRNVKSHNWYNEPVARNSALRFVFQFFLSFSTKFSIFQDFFFFFKLDFNFQIFQILISFDQCCQPFLFFSTFFAINFHTDDFTIFSSFFPLFLLATSNLLLSLGTNGTCVSITIEGLSGLSIEPTINSYISKQTHIRHHKTPPHVHFSSNHSTSFTLLKIFASLPQIEIPTTHTLHATVQINQTFKFLMRFSRFVLGRSPKPNMPCTIFQLTSLSGRAFTIITADTINTGSAVETCSASTIIYIDRTISTGPSVHAYARKSTE